ncbi:MAG: hypothetical protein JRH20_08185 [Deltaproteobacteria bacterium]|nr:hypothetical protein [Deltaproteobacteria bacterium]
MMRLCFVLSALSLSWFCAGHGHSADTTEPFDKGAIDAEVYLGVADPGATTGAAVSDLVLGYGLTKRLSLVVGTSLEGGLSSGDFNAEIHLGGLCNVVNTEHFDLDLMLMNHGGGEDFQRWQAEPGVELNLDSDGQRQGVGLYLRTSVAFGTHPEKTDTGHRILFAWEVASTLGAYWTMSADHQLLVEADMGMVTRPESAFVFGGVAVGYNVVLTSWLELLNQVTLDVPQGEESVGYTLSLGVIMTL